VFIGLEQGPTQPFTSALEIFQAFVSADIMEP
jgi:hypothetical protein